MINCGNFGKHSENDEKASFKTEFPEAYIDKF